MGSIHKLSRHMANLVAAGEVVERPASVVKELVENSMDAGAAHITIETKNGGNVLIRITDDGCGMVREDAELSFERHATSKIAKPSDLEEIGTLGFRGEALASVAAVSHVEMLTRTKELQEGTRIEIACGETLDISEVGCPVGTTIIVRDLFSNVPARAKFLKTDTTENGHIEAVLSQAAMANPQVGITYIRDGKEIFSTPGDGKLLHAIHVICGKQTASQLMTCAGEFGNISLDGYITNPDFSRQNRNMQYFFVNGRPVRSRTLSAAVEQAYKGRLMGGRHPACFLNLHIHLAFVDVNVHPAKLEVKFSYEKEVFSAVYHSIQASFDAIFKEEGEIAGEALFKEVGEENTQTKNDIDSQKPTFPTITLGRDLTVGESFASTQERVASSAPVLNYSISSAAAAPTGYGAGYMTNTASPYLSPVLRPLEGEDLFEEDSPEERAAGHSSAYAPSAVTDSSPAAEQDGEITLYPMEETPLSAVTEREPIVLGEVFKTYIIVEYCDDLWLLDKHAAHEKLIYNKLAESVGEVPAQVLLTPVVVPLSPVEKAACIENEALLQTYGFDIEDFGAGTVIVRQIPVYLDEKDTAFTLSDIAEKLLLNKNDMNEKQDSLLKSISCRSAIKAGQISQRQELQSFVKQVLNMPDVQNCPHGRPVGIKLSRGEIEKLFKRKL